MYNTYNKKEGTSIREIILEHLKKILEISRCEFRGGYYEEKFTGNVNEKIYVPDSRKQYIQAVESLSDVLLPYYDKDMEERAKAIDIEIEESLNTFEKSKKSTGSKEHNVYVITKLKLMRMLFQQINYLLHRNNYLKTKIYEEGAEDDEDDINEESD